MRDLEVARQQWLPVMSTRSDKEVGSRPVGTGFDSNIVVGSRQDGTKIAFKSWISAERDLQVGSRQVGTDRD